MTDAGGDAFGRPPSEDPTTLHVRRAVTGDMESLEWVVRRVSPLLLAQARYRIAPRLQGVHDPEDRLPFFSRERCGLSDMVV